MYGTDESLMWNMKSKKRQQSSVESKQRDTTSHHKQIQCTVRKEEGRRREGSSESVICLSVRLYVQINRSGVREKDPVAISYYSDSTQMIVILR